MWSQDVVGALVVSKGLRVESGAAWLAALLEFPPELRELRDLGVRRGDGNAAAVKWYERVCMEAYTAAPVTLVFTRVAGTPAHGTPSLLRGLHAALETVSSSENTIPAKRRRRGR